MQKPSIKRIIVILLATIFALTLFISPVSAETEKMVVVRKSTEVESHSVERGALEETIFAIEITNPQDNALEIEEIRFQAFGDDDGSFDKNGYGDWTIKDLLDAAYLYIDNNKIETGNIGGRIETNNDTGVSNYSYLIDFRNLTYPIPANSTKTVVLKADINDEGSAQKAYIAINIQPRFDIMFGQPNSYPPMQVEDYTGDDNTLYLGLSEQPTPTITIEPNQDTSCYSEEYLKDTIPNYLSRLEENAREGYTAITDLKLINDCGTKHIKWVNPENVLKFDARAYQNEEDNFELCYGPFENNYDESRCLTYDYFNKTGDQYNQKKGDEVRIKLRNDIDGYTDFTPGVWYKEKSDPKADESIAILDNNELNALAETATAELLSRKIIHGYPDGEMRGDNPINRAEVVKIMIEALNETTDDAGQSDLTDLPQDAWYTPYAKKAVSMDIIGGYPDKTFKGANQINTVELLKILSNTFHLETDLDYSYTDIPSFTWYTPYVGIATKYNLFPDRSSELLPNKELTRNEVIIAIYQILTYK